MIYIFLANGFEEIEAVSVIDILRRANIEVKVVGVSEKFIVGAHGIKIEADLLEKDLILGDVDGIILPGGLPGADNLYKSKTVCKAVDYCMHSNKLVAAICAAPSILGKLGYLKEREATCYPGFEKNLLGAKISSESVCKSDNIITAKGPGAALMFSLKIVELIKGTDAMLSLKNAMQMI